jgi:hypothetical protein
VVPVDSRLPTFWTVVVMLPAVPVTKGEGDAEVEICRSGPPDKVVPLRVVMLYVMDPLFFMKYVSVVAAGELTVTL